MQTSIGAMRERVTIQREVRTDDGAGGALVAWDNLAIVWARVTPISGNDIVRAQALALNITHRVLMRWRADLDNPGAERYRLLWFSANGARVMNIIGHPVNLDERRRFLQITCESGQGVAL